MGAKKTNKKTETPKTMEYYGGTASMIKPIVALLDAMPYDERLEILNHFCRDCGRVPLARECFRYERGCNE